MLQKLPNVLLIIFFPSRVNPASVLARLDQALVVTNHVVSYEQGGHACLV